jgi:colanic acid/amylovoran biosynthesis glycosyltransferase
MKVCFVTHDSSHDIGGAATWLRRLLPLLQMADIEVEVHVVALDGKPGVNCAFFKAQGIPVRWTPLIMHVPHAVRALLKLLRKTQPDIYVPNGIIPAYYAAGYAKLAGIPIVGVLHNDDVYNRAQVDDFILGDADFRVSAVVAVSSFLESRVSSMAAALGVLVRRIGCGVPIPERTAEFSGSVFRLVYIGRLSEYQKKIRDVANALCGVAQIVPNLEAWIVGEGPDQRDVEDIIKEKTMITRVHLLGWVDNTRIYDVLAQCHCLVLLSDFEGLPVSMLEGMAAGVVPICLDMRSGIREAIEHGVNGLIVKDRGADFCAAVRGLQSDPAKWQQLSLAARETARQRYSIEECARQWTDLLENLNRQRPARADWPAFGTLRLPPPNPKYWIFGMNVPWNKRLKEYIKSVPPIYQVASAAVTGLRKVKSARAP